MRDTYSECVAHGTCYDEGVEASAAWSSFEWLILLFLLGLTLWLIVRLVDPPKPKKPIAEFVSDKLKDYENQAKLFGRDEASNALKTARTEIDAEFLKRNITERQ